MEVASPGSYHEHKGRWNGNVIQFERMSKSVAVKPVIEDFAIGFPSTGRITVTSAEEAPAGRSARSWWEPAGRSSGDRAGRLDACPIQELTDGRCRRHLGRKVR